MKKQKLTRSEKLAERLTVAFESLSLCVDVKKKCFRMVDVERGKVYKTHLGKKLR